MRWLIATDKALFSSEKCWYLSYFSTKTYVVGTHQKGLGEVLLMSTHNICFRWEIRKILCGYPLLSVTMLAHFMILHQGFIGQNLWLSSFSCLGRANIRQFRKGCKTVLSIHNHDCKASLEKRQKMCQDTLSLVLYRPYIFEQTDLSRQCRPGSDAGECNIWSKSGLFAIYPAVYRYMDRESDGYVNIRTSMVPKNLG